MSRYESFPTVCTSMENVGLFVYASVAPAVVASPRFNSATNSDRQLLTRLVEPLIHQFVPVFLASLFNHLNNTGSSHHAANHGRHIPRLPALAVRVCACI